MPAKRTRIANGLYQRGKSFSVGYTDPSGRWVMVTLKGCRNVTEAKQAQTQLMAKLGRGELASPSRVKLADIFEEWIVSLDRKPRTVNAYRSSWRTHLEPLVGRKTVQGFTITDSLRLVAELKKRGLKASSISVALAVLSNMFSHAMLAGLVYANPVRLPRGTRPTLEKKVITMLAVEELESFLGIMSEPYRKVAYLQSWTGLRMGEALGLQWGDIDFEVGSISVTAQKAQHSAERVSPKTARSVRTIPLDPDTIRFLREHRLASYCSLDSDFVFCDPMGAPIHERNYARAVAKVAKTMGLDGLTSHALRHRFGSLLAESGVPYKSCAMIMGHTVNEFMSTYLHEFEQEKQHDLVRQALVAARI